MFEAVSALFTTLFSGYIEKKKAESAAKVAGIQANASYSDAAVSRADFTHSYLVATFTVPLWGIMYGAIFDPSILPAIRVVFDNFSQLPSMYWTIMGTMVLGTFGITGYTAWTNKNIKMERMNQDVQQNKNG